MDEAFINPFRQVHLAVGMVRKATVDAAVIYLGGSKGTKEEEKDEATHFQEEKLTLKSCSKRNRKEKAKSKSSKEEEKDEATHFRRKRSSDWTLRTA